MTLPLILLGKIVFHISRILNIGSGGTWPGEIALTLSPRILSSFSQKLKKGIILVAGTNGKTTTALMIRKILENKGYKVFHNDSGANLLNGIVSAFIQNSSWSGNLDADFGVFEVDENTLPSVISNYPIIQLSNDEKKLIIVFLNLFRDQLDRYGEVDVIAEKWSKALKKLPVNTKIILNADDPQIAYLGKNLKSNVSYFGINNPKAYLKNFEHATDSTFCLNCGHRLSYEGIYYSHIGIWRCGRCGEKRPKPDISSWKSSLPGLYNQYNTLAAVGAVKSLGVDDGSIKKALADFSPAFGRQEEFEVSGKRIKIFLSKNPAGFNQSLRTVLSRGAKEILFILNDRIPDGRDVSWIWDVDFEMLPDNTSVVVSGDRVYDLALRVKYSQNFKNQKYKLKIKSFENLEEAINYGLEQIDTGDTFYILPTYSAMLSVRKILKGRKIL